MAAAVKMPADSAAQALLEVLQLPSAVGDAVRSAVTAQLNGGSPTAPAPLRDERTLAPGWRLRPDAKGGWLLMEAPGGAGAPRPWAAGDRCGTLHLTAAWQGGALQAAWLRLPADGWLELRPRAGEHPLWGPADALVHHPTAPQPGGGAPVGLLPALDYGRLESLPPFDRPAALPPGAGGAVLNLLAWLCVLQGRERVHYRGPYPTPALFGSLCRSFVPEGDANRALTLFTRDETALAFRGTAVDNPVPWRPAPFAPCRVAPDLLLHLRDGVETAWVRDVPFRRASTTPGGAFPAGERVWQEGSGEAAGWGVGLALLGRPFASLYRLAADGTVRQTAPPDDAAPDGSQPLDGRWRPVLIAWATLRAHAALAATVAALEHSLVAEWAPLPLRIAELRGDTLRLQSALVAEFVRRVAQEDAAGLAMMLVSDVLEAATPRLLAHAQASLEAESTGTSNGQPPLPDASGLLAAGEAAQGEARHRLEHALPDLVQALARGEALPETG